MSLKVAFASSATGKSLSTSTSEPPNPSAIYELWRKTTPSWWKWPNSHDQRRRPWTATKASWPARSALLSECAAVYCNAVGASAIKQLLAAGIQPMKVEEGMVIDELLCGLNQAMLGSPPAWMAKYLKKQAPAGDRFTAMEDEGWSE
jgi:hypothetical protein